MSKPRLAILIRGTLLGGFVAVSLLQLRSLGLLQGSTAVVLAGLLVVLVPVSQSLSRRILLLGSIALGWLQVSWWIDLGPFDDRVGWILALGWGVLVGWVFASPSVSSRLRSLAPKLRPADALPVATAAFGVWLYAPFFRSGSDGQTLTLLMKSGWDHVAHFTMYEWFARGGTLASAYAPTADHSTVVFQGYPTGFHMFAAALGDLVGGPAGSGGIHSYGVAISFSLIVVATLIAAGICQLPSVIRRPAIAVPLVALPVAAFYLGPGSLAVAAGYPNFTFACATVGIAAAMAVTIPRIVAPLQIFALCGLIVATAHSWILLLPLSAVAAIVVLFPWSRSRWRASRTRLALAIASVVAGLLGVGIAALVAVPNLNSETLLVGQAGSFSVGMTVLACAVALGVGVLGAWHWLMRGRRPDELRSALLALIPLLAFGMMVVIGVEQVRRTGSLLYYFEKLATGSVLVTLIVVSIVAAPILSSRISQPSGKIGRFLPWLGSVLIALGVIQLFGYAGPSFGGVIKEAAPGLKYRQDSTILTAGPSAEATRMERAAKIASKQPPGTTIYFAPLPGDPLPQLANQWHHALSGTWSEGSDAAAHHLGSKALEADFANGIVARQIRVVLGDEPSIKVIVAPEVRAEVEGQLSDEQNARLLSW
jgi:hypothetical protein